MSALTNEQLERLVALLKAGNYIEIAVRAIGVEIETFDELLREDEELRERVARARAEAEARSVASIANAARENWQAAAWLLERQYPERYARPALRQEEKPQPIVVGSDRLDDLASRRAARREAR